jgi:epoxyqueuosine reductase QueG
MSLKERVKQAAYDLGADLVGFGDIGRCEHAPLMMSPQGLMPSAKTVIVLAIHHPDACIELGGERHSQEIGPYSVQYLMNSRLDEMAYRLATVIEQAGWGAMPIASSNIWRYNQYKDLKAVFAPDVSHIYMAVVAGLAEIGFSGLALTPEYGARNRFITVITDAEVEPDPLIPPGTVCDGCMLCRKHCPAQALSKEIDGEKVLRIGPYEYRFPNKNLWRCAWGEHFDLDLDLPIPDVVDEKVILDAVAAHGIRGGEMGQCLKYCLPEPLRTFDREYSSSPVRAYPPSDGRTLSRAALDRLLARPCTAGADEVIVSDVDSLSEAGVDLERFLPGARSAVTVLVQRPTAADDGHCGLGASYQLNSLCYDLARGLEDLSARSVMTLQGCPPRCQPEVNPTGAILERLGLATDNVFANTVITRQTIAPQRRRRDTSARLDAGNARADLTSDLIALARSSGADLVGVAPADRMEELAGQLADHFDGDSVLEAVDRSIRFTRWEPQITQRQRAVRRPGDWLEGAKSVLVFGLRMHREVLQWATRPPAEAVGPYCFQSYATTWLNTVIGYRLTQRLGDFGYAGVMTTDLSGTASVMASPRGLLPDQFSNRFAAVAAGLGWLTTSGHLATSQFGLRQRCLAIVTDAPLTASPLVSPAAEMDLCRECDERCVAACPTQAFTAQRVELTCEGHQYAFLRTDPKRCDWAKRHALVAKSGFGYLGSPLDEPPPEPITPEALADALRQHDPIKKYRPVVAEPCVIECPYKAIGI